MWSHGGFSPNTLAAIFDFGNKIAELIDDPDARARMGREGRERVLGALSWAHSAPVLLAAYDRVFEKRG